MEEIDNFNCAGLCSQQYCSEIESNFLMLDVNGMIIFVSFCLKHSEEYDKRRGEALNKYLEEKRNA